MAEVYCGCFLTIFTLIIITNYGYFILPITAEIHPAPDFSRHTLIKTRIYHGREKRQIQTTKEGDGKYVHHLSIAYNLDGKEYILDLRLNRELLSKGYFRKYQKNGKHVISKPKEEEVELCQYKGNIRDVANSWVALSTCNNNALTGVIYDGKEMHYVQKASDDNLHFLYKHSDLVNNNKTCGYGEGNVSFQYSRPFRYKRTVESVNHVKGPYNANRQSRYVELVLVVDNSEYKEMGENLARLDDHCKNIANIINGLYTPLNIFVALVGIVVWTERDEINFSANGDTTLTNFLHYRREKLIKEHPNDNAQLLTKITFEHGVVGKALKGPICTIEYSGGVNTDHSPVVGLVATTVAHEMGHNFGMEHDTNECVCPEDRCIMAPSSSAVPPSHWSSCSLEYLALAFEHGMDYCLRNKPKAIFDSPVCGNGFVESGEQCDCGLPNHCDNTCCNATTCTLHKNATCATGECCDLEKCQPKSASTLCRSADYECDLPEYCTGHSEYCPPDIHKMDTETCDGGKAYCYKGYCRTRSDQCKLLWGETGKSSDDQCYLLNTKGSRHGNCGYNKLNQSFFKCKDEDIFCGMLHCKHLNERLEFGMESVAILSHSFINVKGSVVPCRTALVDLGINQIDPGLAPDGAKCGESMMCVNQKCMSIENLRAATGNCPNNCNGNGICNSLGHCHCKDGFAPPFCDYPGFGGSEDSGPTSDPEAGKQFVTALFIIFLGIIPALAIVGFLLYYTKHNIRLSWKQSSLVKKSPSKPRSSFPQSSIPTKLTEDIHSLLQEEASARAGFKNDFFGNFKGFSIAPLKQREGEPIRPAPPVPNVLCSEKEFEVPPALPPLNPGAHPRPIISSPILETSTCTAKELFSPLRNAPKVPFRPAPVAPVEHKRPLSSPDTIVVSTIMPEEEKKRDNNGGALNRIASFLKPEKRAQNFNTLPKKLSNVLDKSALRSIEISNPILQTDIIVPTSSTVVMRAQSMRNANMTQRPAIPNFGSMRNPNNAKRPVSIPAANRPKSPPPPRPSLPEPEQVNPKSVKVPNLPGYLKPCATKQNQYDDCLNESLTKIKEEKDNSSVGDNIYAVIDETPVTSPELETKRNSVSSENAGLLGEIVSEIQNLNGDSIYSTSTLARKKKSLRENEVAEKEASKDDELYVNTASLSNRMPENIYSNMNNAKSSASSTSSGYITPSSVNLPSKPVVKQPNPKPPPLSTFKAEPKSITKHSPTKMNNKGMGKQPNRQTTPSNLRTRRSSPTRTPFSSPKPLSNSPDLVTSCSNTENNFKSPDVLNSAPSILKKPNLPKGAYKFKKVSSIEKTSNSDESKSSKASKSLGESETKSISLGAKSTVRQNSNVAALQKKFENKSSAGIQKNK